MTKRGIELGTFCSHERCLNHSDTAPQKGKKEGVGSKMVRFMVAIAYNRGVIKCHHYEGAINEEMCKLFIEYHFSDMFEQDYRFNAEKNYRNYEGQRLKY